MVYIYISCGGQETNTWYYRYLILKSIENRFTAKTNFNSMYNAQ